MLTRRHILKIGTCASMALAAERPRILLISGWNTKNIGDVAHTPGFIRLAERHFPDAEITVAVANLPLFEPTRDYLKQRWPKMNVVQRPSWEANKPIFPEYLSAFERANLVVVNSGMTMSFGYYGHELDRYKGNIFALQMARDARKPYGVFGHSFDRMDPPGDVWLRGLLSNAAFIYTRDSESLKLIRSKGVKARVMDFGPDAAFGFDLRDDGPAAAFMKSNGLEPKRFLAFIPRLDITRFEKDGRETALAQKHRDLLTQWVRQTKMPVVIVHEVEGQIAPARQMVFDQLPDDVKPLVKFRSEFWWPDEAASLYAQSLAVVSLEMHSVILGLAVGTPSLHPYFRQAGLKQWMMQDIGRPEWLFDIDQQSLDPLVAEMVRIHKDPAGANKRAAEAMRFVNERQTQMMREVRAACASA